MQLTFPVWYDHFAEFEYESKGYLEGVSLYCDEKIYILNFYDQSRLQQNIHDEINNHGFWLNSNVIVLAEVTRSAIEEVVQRFSKDDLQQFFGAASDSC